MVITPYRGFQAREEPYKVSKLIVKKLPKKRQHWLNQRVLIQWRSSVKAANLAGRSTTSKPVKLRVCVLTVPRLLIAEKLEQRLQILNVISQVRERLAGGGYRVKLDFSKVEKIFPGGMLVLLSAMERLASRYPGRISARCPPNSLAAQLLNHFGLANTLGVNPRMSRPRASSVVDWSYLTGTQAAGEEVKELLDKYRRSTDAEIPEGLFAVLTEGLTNVRHHAYTDDTDLPAELRKWWLFARYAEPKSREHGSLFIAIYDMGAGIPATMRNKLQKKEVVIDWIDKATELAAIGDGTALDKRLLQVAVDHRRSQTGQPHRGNGLPEMREFIAATDEGRLHIVSGRAQYSFLSGKNDGHSDGFKQKFPGTLLLWSLPLKAKEQ